MDTGLNFEAVPSQAEIDARMAWDRANPRTVAPGHVVRVLGWLLRPIIWEAMRQHPGIDYNREVGEPLITLADVISGRNRRLGFGP